MRFLVPLGLAAACAAQSPVDTLDSDPSAGVVECVEGFGVGDCAPDFTLPDHSGEPESLSDHSGQRVIVIGTSMW